MKDKFQFDMDAALPGLREGKGLSGKAGILTPLIIQFTEAVMQSTLDEHLARAVSPKRMNDTIRKTMKSPAIVPKGLEGIQGM